MLPNLKEAKKRTNRKVNTIHFSLDNKYINCGIGKKYYLKTYGCQMNEHDSENISAIIEYMGFASTDTYCEADLIILNTCSIRENANNKVFGMLGRIKHLKSINKDIIVGMTGCMPQEEIVTNRLIEKYRWMDFVIGTHNINEIGELIYKSLKERELKVEVPSIEGNIIEDMPCKRVSNYTAFVNIMYGCDKFCTYCIVPYTRGKQRSRNKEDIVNEVINLKNNGYKEVVLLGQNVNAYGKDLDNDYSMSDLLQDIANTKIDRIRFVTSHPWDLNKEMIDVIRTNQNIMPSLHLPVQSGSNKILKLMGRRYTKENYIKLFFLLKERIPNMAITTDIIVGFPNETKGDFDETLELVNTCKFDLAYTFIYSKREGTPAAMMKDSISLEEKEERLQILNNLINKYAKEANDKYLNKELEVLVLGNSIKNSNMLYGYSKENKLVNFKGDRSLIGTIKKIKITSCKTWSLDGIVK